MQFLRPHFFQIFLDIVHRIIPRRRYAVEFLRKRAGSIGFHAISIPSRCIWYGYGLRCRFRRLARYRRLFRARLLHHPGHGFFCGGILLLVHGIDGARIGITRNERWLPGHVFYTGSRAWKCFPDLPECFPEKRCIGKGLSRYLFRSKRSESGILFGRIERVLSMDSPIRYEISRSFFT